MLSIAILTIFSLGLIVLVAYYQTSDIIIKKNKEYTSDMFLQVNETINSNCEQIDKIAMSVAYDMVIQDYLTANDYDEKLTLVPLLDNLFRNITYLREGIMDIVVIGEPGNSYSMKGSTDFVNNYKSLIETHNKPSYIGIEKLNSGIYEDKMCFVVGMPVYSTNPDKFSQNSIGVIALVLNYNIFDSSIEKINKTPIKYYLLDSKFSIIANNDNKDNGTRFDLLKYDEIVKNTQTVIPIDGKKSIVQTIALESINGSIISITPQASLLQELYNLREKILMVFVIALALISIPFFITLNNILQPIKKLMDFMVSISSGNLKDLKKRISIQGYSEMTLLANELNQLLDEIDGLTRRLVETSSTLYRVELEKKQSELSFLQSQINPHFLYNTIESIRALASIKGVNEICDMTKALGRILRYGVKGADEVKLSEELDIVKYYIQIQKIRFKDRFEVYEYVSPATLNAIVPKMILQPLVENAIFHGLEPSMKEGSLKIYSEINENNIMIISIKDNGVGIAIDELERTRYKLTNTGLDNPFQISSGIGIINVHNRIKLKYGKEFGISINSEVGIGTEVIVKIPVRRDNNV